MPFDRTASIRAKRQLELAAFLRARRGALTPEDVGLPRSGRRHVKGLRRDEVAQLAGIGVSWYTLIEQGRDVNVSPETIVRVAEALRLDPIRMSHLLALALPVFLNPPPPGRTGDDVVRRLQVVIDTQRLDPAHVLDDAFTVVAWNALAERFYGFRREAEGFERNLVWRLFNEPAFGALFTDWDDAVANFVALLRANFARSVGNPEYEALVFELYDRQPVFRQLWDTHHVHARQTEICRFNHAVVGEVTLRLLYATAQVEPPLHIVFLVPDDEASIRALEHLERIDRYGSAQRGRIFGASGR